MAEVQDKIVADSLVWFPMAEFTAEWVASLQERLSVFILDFNPNREGKGDLLRNYVIDEETGYMGIPYHHGLLVFGKEEIEMDLVEGFPIECPLRPDPSHPSASAGQARLIADARYATQTNTVTLITAPTGAGKTVVGLDAVAELGRTTLVIVRTKVLARQWTKQIQAVLGVPKDQIGKAFDGDLKYEGKSFVVAILNTVVNKELPEEFYDYFGTVVWDEAHILGAAYFARSMGLFAAKHRIALTATPKRKDGAAKVFLDYFGPPKVVGKGDAVPATCLVYTRHTDLGLVEEISRPKLLNKLTTNQARNTDLAAIIFKLWKSKRAGILVISERIEQLQILFTICCDMGIPEQSMGVFTRQWTDDKGKRHTTTDNELDDIAANAEVIFATYGLAKEGLDIPRLDAGVEASPQSDAVQAIGRIRRPLPNKLTPIWISIDDEGVPALTGMTDRRLRSLKKVNVDLMPYEKN